MNIGPYSFAAFRDKVVEFHGYAAPGVLVGGYMTARAQSALPADILYEALVESRKCLPDAVQLLTPCSAGNNRLHVLDLGRYALALYDKYSGVGARVRLDLEKLRLYPELRAWLLKAKDKRNQDEERLLREIEAAGESVCAVMPIRAKADFLGAGPSLALDICRDCGEPFPRAPGPEVCRACRGENPYLS